MSDKYVLWVEGTNDAHVIKQLAEKYGIAHRFEIKSPAQPKAKGSEVNELEMVVIQPQGGIDKLKANLPIRLKKSDLERLGIVVDADENMNSVWAFLRDKLKMPKVSDPDPTGTIVDLQLPGREQVLTVGIWIMPNNVLPGKLEDFIRFLVPKGDSLIQRAKNCVDQIPLSERNFKEKDKIKAHIHTWLAWQENPGVSLASAINNSYLDTKVPQARQFVEWLCNLFSLSSDNVTLVKSAVASTMMSVTW